MCQETACAPSAILPNLSTAAMGRKVAHLSPSVDRLFRGSQNTLACDVTSLLHLFAHLSYSLSPCAAVAWPKRFVVGL